MPELLKLLLDSLQADGSWGAYETRRRNKQRHAVFTATTELRSFAGSTPGQEERQIRPAGAVVQPEEASFPVRCQANRKATRNTRSSHAQGIHMAGTPSVITYLNTSEQ